MLVAYKTEINPTAEQRKKINQTIGVARFIKNMYIAHNKEVYENGGSFVSSSDFSKWINNGFIPSNPEYRWIKDVYAKSTKQAIINTEKAFKDFFKGLKGFPNFSKKKDQNTKMYFVKNDKKQFISCARHRINIPTLGWIRLKEKGYIPIHNKSHTEVIIKSGTISRKADRYYISVLVEQNATTVRKKEESNDTGLGIDLGVKDFAIRSDGEIHKNINKTAKVKKLEKKLKREQRSLSRKYENLKKRGEKSATQKRANIDKNILRVQKLHKKLADIRLEYVKSVVIDVVKTKPQYITIEDLNVKGMMKNKHLSKAIAEQCFYKFQIWLEAKCKEYGIELRQVGKFYPSSKLCSCCGQKKVDLKLSDRVFTCNNCGHVMDRDLNASINLLQATEYTILT